MHLYVGPEREVYYHDPPCQGDQAEKGIVAFGPSLGNYIFLLVGNGGDLGDNSFM
jgi:hypothetical protein